MIFSAVLLLSVVSTAWAADKHLIPTSASSTFPSCGLSCSELYAAQDSCTANADSSTWVSCFCQSSFVSNLKTSGAVCSNCDASDQALVSTWYSNYCSSGGTTTSTTSSATSSSTSTATAASSSSKSSTSATNGNQSWWSTHYQWVIMLIVLAIGFSVIAALGIWFKRRYDAKRPGLYHGGTAEASSSGALRGGNSGVLASSAPNQSRNFGDDSVASSSRTDIAPKTALAPGSRTRLQRTGQSPAADVEIRQISRQ
ncbi:hypothetical protein N7523_006479 [Penicillium sp. IBT 18751x]|nr:hypothetical protein N7523_006479 [Penicillium sp. IBT 18751x]